MTGAGKWSASRGKARQWSPPNEKRETALRFPFSARDGGVSIQRAATLLTFSAAGPF
jgi:hypothetical protein